MASSKTLIKKNKTLATAKLAVAFSGGLDSTVLLHATVLAHGPKNVLAFHVHHGIQRQATQWQRHCERVAKKLGCYFDTRNIQLPHASNLEAQARTYRYQALREMCEAHQVKDLMVAHHQDDQAETVLIQLMRGAGLAGLSGMPALKINKLKASNLGDVNIWRPFLDLRRADLEIYAKENKLDWIEDPSNQDESYRRNAIRKSLLPQLEKVQQGAISNLARSARHLAEAQDLLNQLADIDLGLIDRPEGLSKTNLLRLYKTSQPRAKNALRRWLNKHGLAYPNEERLASWFAELQQVRVDARLHWEHDGVLIRLWRGYLLVEIKQEQEVVAGEWVFKKLSANSKKIGISKSRFDEAKKKGLINTMRRHGGEKFKTQLNRPRKSLKNLYQEANIPPWQRDLPLLYIGDELVAVAGIGISADWQVSQGARMVLEWLPN
jgi:tRNA(Ile)-lysidine synthase